MLTTQHLSKLHRTSDDADLPVVLHSLATPAHTAARGDEGRPTGICNERRISGEGIDGKDEKSRQTCNKDCNRRRDVAPLPQPAFLDSVPAAGELV